MHELVVVDQVLDVLVLSRANDAHVDDVRVDVARVEQVLRVGVVHLAARLACVQLRVVADERVLEELDLAVVEGGRGHATLFAIEWRVEFKVLVNTQLVNLKSNFLSN